MRMELRSQSHRDYVKILKDAGVYEEGMNNEEVKELAQAMEISAKEQLEENEEYLQFERARYESELEFFNSHQSTMLQYVMTPPRTSPEPMAVDMDLFENSTFDEPIHLTVRAIVHHAHDWSPSNECRTVRKRRSSSIVSEGKRIRSDNNNNNNQAQQQQAAAAEGHITPPSMESIDSGLSGDELSSIPSSSYESSSVLSIGEIPSGLVVSTSSAAVSDASRSIEIYSIESHMC